MAHAPGRARVEPGRTLVFDADDTLWENNVYFERVIADYLDWLAHPSLDRAAVRQVLDDIERANLVSHGYGSAAFLHNLAECFHRLMDRPASDREREEIHGLATDLLAHRIELLPGVADTLTELATRHRLLLLTKGDPAEQQAKIDASGLAHHFAAAAIVPEKDAAVYRELLDRHGVPPASGWMVGNSPRSDILPARSAGMGAVYLPHRSSWVLEHADLDPDDPRILVLSGFEELLLHF
ncbi:HAD family hydrolase [Nakamurella endophytica]|uniref:Haloacid dehalogenase n=1 Tax=Nakamurella endophytica TaxID=1748367 RepID=A0A917WF88_9ACTN|nr:HAD family hydrolase [Nakamurella endophytica]GGM00223.1 haloacid dehalogenase [Nakamurella endophytica]